MADGSLFRVVGWGPFRLPGERRQWRKAEESARQHLALAEEAASRRLLPEERSQSKEAADASSSSPSPASNEGSGPFSDDTVVSIERAVFARQRAAFEEAMATLRKPRSPVSRSRETDPPQLTAAVDDAGNRWLVYRFAAHGIGGEQDLEVAVEGESLRVTAGGRPFSIPIRPGVGRGDIETGYIRDEGVFEVRLPMSVMAPAPDVAELSSREREIAELVIRGLSRTAIAKRLSVSRRTVENHIEHIYRKLNIHSGSDLAAVLARGDRRSFPHD
jgi:DNA-binding CsgD family transcriptional regulator